LVRLPLFFSLEQFDRFQAATKDMVKNKRGTTTLAFIFDKGVIVAADSRASMGGYICEQLVFSWVWSPLGDLSWLGFDIAVESTVISIGKF
jgi:hypothetical protein